MSDPTAEEVAAVLAALGARQDEPEPGYRAWRSRRRAALRRADRDAPHRAASR